MQQEDRKTGNINHGEVTIPLKISENMLHHITRSPMVHQNESLEKHHNNPQVTHMTPVHQLLFGL